ncbi:lysine N(6)-hydroxylase/L-ornithine N(5)-oxygenase family protein [Rhizomonospora bruguierae]|uniref:lysine N(6)-hydroxylase/L-ornithine N(5)-oxygenase family protein n=1 Tax=Rhizomonospora bruguierae TaxID=1581705 RepID=UPI001BCC6790|nr:SidA/IucD/PvdA family monooxygenase [Micromonospora sp. NBRC 107566]
MPPSERSGSTRPPRGRPYDFVAVGLGPFNLGLACLTEPIGDLDGVFLERRDGHDWHPGMLLEGNTLQAPFLADLVTLADPTSPYSFLNYLKHTGRLYPFYLRESFFPLHGEYVDYCRWAANRLTSVRFGQNVEAVEHDAGVYLVHTKDVTYRARRLVLGTGTPPNLPEPCQRLGGEVVYGSGYLAARAALRGKRSITVVGSGQSAAEIFYDLLQGAPEAGYEVAWVTRSPSPEHPDYFHALPAGVRDRLGTAQKQLSEEIDADLVNAICGLLYPQSVGGPVHARLMTNTAVVGTHPTGGGYTLDLRHEEHGERFSLHTEGLVLATGYRYEVPPFLAPIADRIARDAEGRFAVRRDHRVDGAGPPIYAQNAEPYPPGFVAPDLGMGAYRNSCVIRDMLGREHYPVERSIAFGEFGAPRMREPDAREREVVPA